MNSLDFRPLAPGMGQAVAERTVLRRKEDGSWETWGDVAARVSLGNVSLIPHQFMQDEKLHVFHDAARERALLRKHIAKATLLMSGRHLQHGDSTQPTRNMEVFTNCSTAAASFLSFYLLLNGSGVGRCYDDDMMLVNWDCAPTLRCVLDSTHADFDWAADESKRDAEHKYGRGDNVIWFEVPDSREGWAQALEKWEVLAFEKIHADKMLVLDFSKVRPKGSPIGGMQGRPASGPKPLMGAFAKAATLKGAGLAPWRQAMYVDHYFAECVLVGGARRAARMSTKHWSDKAVLDFIVVKRPIEYVGKSGDEILSIRAASPFPPLGFLWSSNNSVTVDDEFWAWVGGAEPKTTTEKRRAAHAKRVFELVCEASYADGTGEPGIINVHRMIQNDAGWEDIKGGDFVGSAKFQVDDDTHLLLNKISKAARKKRYHIITNPCGEIVLDVRGGYCVIADLVPFHADTIDEAEEAVCVAVRALIRTNTMDSLYAKEVKRTNRIGVSLTGVHEFAWKFFGLGFRDLIDEEKSLGFWLTLQRLSKAAIDEADRYSAELGVTPPHTVLTIKPAGTTSKLFGLTEGWHLPARREYLRYVQFRNDDPLVQTYKDAGYPTRELVTYSGTTIVGFPTAPVITTLGMGDKLVTSDEATPEEHFQWLRLGEKYWIGEDRGNQISYTLHYDPTVVGYSEFRRFILENMNSIRCCSVMPRADTTSYEYQPETPISKGEFESLIRKIRGSSVSEDISKSDIDCSSGACPVDFKVGDKESL